MQISILIWYTAGSVDEVYLYESAAEAETDYYLLLKESLPGGDTMTMPELEAAQALHIENVPDGNWYELRTNVSVFLAPDSRYEEA